MDKQADTCQGVDNERILLQTVADEVKAMCNGMGCDVMNGLVIAVGDDFLD